MDEVLIKAAQLLDERGWCQNNLEDDNGGLCAIGAINTVLFGRCFWRLEDTVSPRPYVNKVAARIDGYYDAPEFVRLSNWNDQRGRTKEEVQKLLMEAAELDVS